MIPSEAWMLLTAGGSWGKGFNRAMGAGDRAFDALTPADIQFSLQSLPERPYLFGMAAFLDDYPSMLKLAEHEHYILVDRSIEEKWPSRRGERTLRRLVSLGLYETLGGTRCPACLGRGRQHSDRAVLVLLRYQRMLKRYISLETHKHGAEFPVKKCNRCKLLSTRRRELEIRLYGEQRGAGLPCEPCKSSGTITMTSTLRAKLAQIPYRTWTGGDWDSRYSTYLWELKRLEGWAIAHVRSRLRRHAA